MCLPTGTNQFTLVFFIWAAECLSNNTLSKCHRHIKSRSLEHVTNTPPHTHRHVTQGLCYSVADVQSQRLIRPELSFLFYIIYWPAFQMTSNDCAVKADCFTSLSPTRSQFIICRKMVQWSPRGSTLWWSQCSMMTMWAWRTRGESWRRRSSKQWFQQST